MRRSETEWIKCNPEKEKLFQVFVEITYGNFALGSILSVVLLIGCYGVQDTFSKILQHMTGSEKLPSVYAL